MQRTLPLTFVTAIVLTGLASAQERPPQSKTVSDSINLIWKSVAKDFTSLAEAVPEEKWSFKPTRGAFMNARTFAEQVKHVACANQAWATQIIKEKQPEHCDVGGPSPANSKADLLAYLRESFTQMDRAIASMNVGNLLEPMPGEYWGVNRLSSMTAAMWHVSDHYGQLVEYARMNGVVPPASK
jgi:hypothetical protein